MKAKTAIPHLDSSNFSTQLFWMLLSFSIFYFIINKIIVPRIIKIREKRHQITIQYSLQNQEKQKKITAIKRKQQQAIIEADTKYKSVVNEFEKLLNENLSDTLTRLSKRLNYQLKDTENKTYLMHKKFKKNNENEINKLAKNLTNIIKN